MTRICVLGLGLLGRPIARKLLASGHSVRGWNRSPLPENLTQGISLCKSLEEAASAEVCLLVLLNSSVVDEVLSHLEPHLSPGKLVIDMGTSDPLGSQAHAERLHGKGIGWLDAPVSGGPEGAEAGTLAIMAGGNEEDFKRGKPILEALGNVTHMGGPGRGQQTKLVNQTIVALTIEAVAEALTLAEKCGIDPRLVQQALKGGFADSKILQLHGTRMIHRDYKPGGKVKAQLKDLRLALQLASSLSLELPHLESITQRYERLEAQGDGELDHSAVHKLLWQE